MRWHVPFIILWPRTIALARTPTVPRRTFLALGAGALGSSAAGCLSPTLPLPPPDEPESIRGNDGETEWEVRGTCTPGALVLVRNIDRGTIDGADDQNADGRYFVRVRGAACAACEVFELVDGDISPATFFVLEPRENSLGDDSCAAPT